MRLSPITSAIACSIIFIAGDLSGVEQMDERATPPRLALPAAGSAYVGAYVDFGEREENVTREGLLAYEKLVGKKQALIGFSSDWGMQNFPKKQLDIILEYGAVPLIYWSPWDRPLGAPRAQNRFQLKKILAGEWDSYIDMWASSAKDYGKPILVAWGLEMNGQWFPWSGAFYGGGIPIGEDKYQGPENFKDCYRYVVDRVRRAGASNIEWVFHPNNTSDPEEAWNAMANYYPGPEYVDWLGMSAYGMQYPDQKWPVFDLVVPKPYNEITKIDPDKPIILAEFGIGEFPYAGNKAAWLEEAFKRIPAEFPRIKGMVYWHEQWPNGDGKISNLKVDSSAASLAAFRQGIASPAWIERPRIE